MGLFITTNNFAFEVQVIRGLENTHQETWDRKSGQNLGTQDEWTEKAMSRGGAPLKIILEYFLVCADMGNYFRLRIEGIPLKYINKDCHP